MPRMQQPHKRPHAVDAEVCLQPMPPHNRRSISLPSPPRITFSESAPPAEPLSPRLAGTASLSTVPSASANTTVPPAAATELTPRPRSYAVLVPVVTLRNLRSVVVAFERGISPTVANTQRSTTKIVDAYGTSGNETISAPCSAAPSLATNKGNGAITLQLLDQLRVDIDAILAADCGAPTTIEAHTPTDAQSGLPGNAPTPPPNIPKPAPPQDTNHHPLQTSRCSTFVSEELDPLLLELLQNEPIPVSSNNVFQDHSIADSATALRWSASASRVSTHTLVTGEEEETGNKLINQYVVLDDIGSGTCGKVKLAFCLKRNITVAIKVVRRVKLGDANPVPDRRRSLGRHQIDIEDSFRREVALMKKLRHPNVVPLYEVIDDPRADKLYLVMKYAEQGAVGSVRPDGTCTHLALARVVDVALQVGKGLRYLHEHGIVHRDIKPENILSTTEGRAMIADFGVSGLEEGADGAGTPLFMAPELHAPPSSASLSEFAFPVGGPVGHTDMWALGVTLYGLLYGQLPFRSIGEVQRAAVARLPTPPCDDAACCEQRAKWVACVGLLLSKAVARRPTADAFVAATKALRQSLCNLCRDAVLSLRAVSDESNKSESASASFVATASSEFSEAPIETYGQPRPAGWKSKCTEELRLVTSEEIKEAISEARHVSPDSSRGVFSDESTSHVALRLLHGFAQHSLRFEEDNSRSGCLGNAETPPR